MAWSDLLSLTGLGLQLVGIGVSARGLWRSWRTYAPPGERFLDPVYRQARRLQDRIGQAFGRPSKKRATGTLSDGAAIALNARGRAGPGALPQDPAAAIAHLDTWLRWEITRSYEMSERLEDDLESERKARLALEEQLEQVRAELITQDQDIAAGGARLAALGLCVVAGGILFQVAALGVA